jgi:uncharacterized protein YycO
LLVVVGCWLLVVVVGWLLWLLVVGFQFSVVGRSSDTLVAFSAPPTELRSTSFTSAPIVSKSITLTDYSELRPKLRTGDLLLCAGTGWFSKMIQASTQSVWSHVAVIVRLESIDRVMLVESVEPIGVRAVPLSKYLHDYDGAGHPYPGTMRIARHQDFASHATPAGLARLGHYAIDQLGRPYDAYEIAKIAARITLASLTNLTLPLSPAPPLERDREYICSEYAWECYRAAGLELPYDSRGFVAPKDFADNTAIAWLGELGVGRGEEFESGKV